MVSARCGECGGGGGPGVAGVPGVEDGERLCGFDRLGLGTGLRWMTGEGTRGPLFAASAGRGGNAL